MHEPQPIAAAHRELDGASSAAPGAPVADTPDSPDSPDSISALSDAARAVYAAWGASQVKLGLATYAEHRKFRTLKLNSVLSDTFGLQPIGAGCRLRFPGRTDEWMTFLPWAHAPTAGMSSIHPFCPGSASGSQHRLAAGQRCPTARC